MELTHVSASQVSEYEACPRSWYNTKVLGFAKPTSTSQQFGLDLHAVNEAYLLRRPFSFEKTPDGRRIKRLFEAGQKHLPEPYEGLLVEKKISIKTPSGIPWIGYIDLCDVSKSPILITDHKTTSNFRWCKTPQELLRTPQMVSYARWVFENYGTDIVDIRHLYYRTQGEAEVFPVVVTATEENTEEQWQYYLKLVEEMKEWARQEPPTADALPPKPDACGAYGGCFHKQRCVDLHTFVNIDLRQDRKEERAPVMSNLHDIWGKKMGESNGAASKTPIGVTEVPKVAPTISEDDEIAKLEAKLAAAKEKKEAEARAAEAQAKAEAEEQERVKQEEAKRFAELERQAEEEKARLAAQPPSINPPDAPDRNEKPVTQAAAPVEEKKSKKRGRPKKSAIGEVISTPQNMAPSVDEKLFTSPKAESEPSFSLFIDCIPMKGNSDHVLFEDWAVPIFAHVAKNLGVPHIQCVGFGDWKAPLVLALREIPKEKLPPAIVIRSSSTGFAEAYSVFAPQADGVFKGF